MRVLLVAAAVVAGCAPAQTQFSAMAYPPTPARQAGEAAGAAAADSAIGGGHFVAGFASGFAAGFLAPFQPAGAAVIGGAGFVGTSVHAHRSRLPAQRAPDPGVHPPEYVAAYEHAYEERVRQRRYDRGFYGALLGLPVGAVASLALVISALR